MFASTKIDNDVRISQQIDDINLKIIDILNKDSSTPFVDVAKRIGVSDATVHMRVRNLEFRRC
jgi:DNA-binding Lrp family transcriptional regulator